MSQNPKFEESVLTLLEPEEVNYDSAQFGDLCDGYLFGEFRNYRLKKKLGEGGMGQTWLAEELVQGEVSQRVVLKILTKELRGNEEVLKEVRRVFDLTKNLNHSSICPLLGRYVDPDFGDFLVMKYADGGTLWDWFKRQPGHENGLPLKKLLPIFRPLAAALDLAHRNGILHRDVKPQNIMIMGKKPVLIDFGIAARIRPEREMANAQQPDPNEAMEHSSSGTPRYMAPEQMEGKPQNARTDQYALAMVLYEMLTGSLPFSGNRASILLQKSRFRPHSPRFSESVNAAFSRALSFEAEKRFSSCTKFLSALMVRRLMPRRPGSVSPKLFLQKILDQIQNKIPQIAHKKEFSKPGVSVVCFMILLLAVLFIGVLIGRCGRVAEPKIKMAEQFQITETASQNAETVTYSDANADADVNADVNADADADADAEHAAEVRAETEKQAGSDPETEEEAEEETEEETEDEAEDEAEEETKDEAETSKSGSVQDVTGHKAGERMVKTADGIEYAFRWCPAGTFVMGESVYFSQEVTFAKGFWMLETEVTQEMWKSVMGKNPSVYEGDQNPVESVSWNDCCIFCLELSEKLGISVCIPTEAQWEYACRAATSTKFSFGDSASEFWRYGNYCDRSCDVDVDGRDVFHDDGYARPAPVRSYLPNAWGFYDMHGNVAEWCSYAGKDFTASPREQMASISSSRVERGGDWISDVEYCRSAFRYNRSGTDRDSCVGFRVVLEESEE